MDGLKHKALCTLMLALTAPALAEQRGATLELAIQPPAQARQAPAPDSLDLPAPFDREAGLIGRYLDWLATETGAPAAPDWPRVTVEHLPASLRMGFFFPTADAPWREMRIAVSPRSIDRAAGDDGLAVLGELAHEYAHYALLMAENGWQTERETFSGGASHHCDPEFQRLTAGMGDVIWNTYHSNDALRSIAFMIQRACWRDGPLHPRSDS